MMKKATIFMTFMRVFVVFVFGFSSLGISPKAYAQSSVVLLPQPILTLTQPFQPVILKGLKVDAANPFQFEFIIDQGDTSEALESESLKLIKYFLASLAIPESDLWVNLSPYEKERIIPITFGETEMGRDLLAQDYLLKQLTSSLLHPDGEYGSEFWKQIREKVAREYGDTAMPIDTFHKIWIMPEAAKVYEGNGGAIVTESKLKVMLERDYLAQEKHNAIKATAEKNALDDIN
jgi:hypothetical protein